MTTSSHVAIGALDPSSLPTASGGLVGTIPDLSRARSLADVQAIVRRAARLFAAADGATFVLRDGDQCFYADEDAIAPLWKGRRFPMTACISGWSMAHREAVAIEDIYADPRIPHDAYRPTFVRSLAMVPIRLADPIGAIGVYWAAQHRPSEAVLATLQALADSTSITIQNVGLIAELEARIHERSVALAEARHEKARAERELAERVQAEARLRATEEQLRQAQKMEAIGRLAGGIAHDFNNLLSVVLSYSAMSVEDLGPDDPVRADMEEIHRAGQRAAALVRQILLFSRHQVVEPRVLRLDDIMGGLEKMLRRVIGSDITFTVRSAPDVHPTFADPGQIEQVVMNLVVNARDAMPSGGSLTIETANVDLDGDYCEQHLGVTPGAYVMLAVSDTGIGMDRATQARIFEPFFTTKEVGRGTGLGLSTVYGIVKRADGHVWVYSEPGRGTTFKVYLPARPGSAATAVSARPKVASLTGRESIVLVEDDAQVRVAARGILVRAGYAVVDFASPRELLGATALPGVVDLMLTDIVMPQMSGVELIAHVRARWPAVRVLCMSGYTDEAAARHGLLDSGLAFLQKPLTPERLLTRVREVLEAPLADAPPGA
ncbi:MAG: response regulator [Deltaproteobacteria bacterium]|nr:response regulator [Deltaproteobacteria bacterium]